MEHLFSSIQYSVAQARGAIGHLPRPLGHSAIRQALNRECTHQANKVKNDNVQLYSRQISNISTIFILIY